MLDFIFINSCYSDMYKFVYIVLKGVYVTGKVWNQSFYRMPRQSIECPAGQSFYRIPRQSIECQAGQGFYRIPRHSINCLGIL